MTFLASHCGGFKIFVKNSYFISFQDRDSGDQLEHKDQGVHQDQERTTMMHIEV